MVDARTFQALSDPTRLRILSLLGDGSMNVTAMVERLGCTQPAVSRHLKVLKQAGLIVDSRRGKWVEYSSNPSTVVEAASYLRGLSRPSGADDEGGGSRPAGGKGAGSEVGVRASAARRAVAGRAGRAGGDTVMRAGTRTGGGPRSGSEASAGVESRRGAGNTARAGTRKVTETRWDGRTTAGVGSPAGAGTPAGGRTGAEDETTSSAGTEETGHGKPVYEVGKSRDFIDDLMM